MREPIIVNVVNSSGMELPRHQTEFSAGVDLRACLSEDVVIEPMQRKLIGTGIQMELPVGFEAQIRPRSGWAYKHGITVLNSPGTIDSDYRGEVKVLLINLGSEPFKITNGDRIAQMVVAEYQKVKLNHVEVLSDTSRGEGGYGSTGKS